MATSSSRVATVPLIFTDCDKFICGYRKSIDVLTSMPIANVSGEPATQFVVIYSPATEESSLRWVTFG